MLSQLKKEEIQNEDYIPEKIVQRDDKKEVLEEWANNNFLRNLLITSPQSGTGKTVTVKWFMENKFPLDMNSVYVLCDGETPYSLVRKIAENFEMITEREIKRKRGIPDFIDYIRECSENGGERMCLCLDEIDNIVNSYNDNILSSLLHIQREAGGNLHLILISNDYSLKKKLQTKVLSRLNEISIIFDEYRPGQASDILRYYIYEEDLIKDEYKKPKKEILPTLIKFVKEVGVGDMRKVLQYFIVWAEMCDGELNLNQINEEFFNKIMKNETLSIVRNLTIKEKLILLSLIKSNIDIERFRDKIKDVSNYPKKFLFTDSARLRKYHNHIAKKINMKTIQRRRLKHYIYKLANDKNIISKEDKSFGRGGRKSLYHLDERVEDYLSEVVRVLVQDMGLAEEWIYANPLDRELL